MVRFPRGCRCLGAWHVWREAAGTCEVLIVPGVGAGYAVIESRKGKPGHGDRPKPKRHLMRVSMSNRKKAS